MKINFHPRGTSKTIIDKDLEAVDYFYQHRCMCAIPSRRPVKPNYSVVVALMEISSTSTWRTSAITRFISGIWIQFGRSAATVTSTQCISGITKQFHCIEQQNLAVDVHISFSYREMITDNTHIGCAQQASK